MATELIWRAFTMCMLRCELMDVLSDMETCMQSRITCDEHVPNVCFCCVRNHGAYRDMLNNLPDGDDCLIEL